MKLWDLAIRQPVFMTMILLAFVVLGAVSYTRMPVNLFPDVEFPIVAVTTIYPGASPQEVQDNISEKIESAVSSLAGVENVTSTSSEGFSVVVVEFAMDVPDEQATRQVLEQINQLQNQLPRDAQSPIVRRFNPAERPIVVFSISDTSGRLSPVELRRFVEEAIQRPLERVAGVASVDVNGGQTREIQVNLNQQALQARRIAPQQVISALQTENLDIPGGRVVTGDQQVLIRTPGSFQTLDDIRNVVISQREAPIYLRDVAEVVDGFAERVTLNYLNGTEAVVINIRKQSGANTSKVAEEVKKELAVIGAAYPDLAIAVGRDESVFVDESTADAFNDLIWGGLLAGLVVLFFFRNLRNTIITMIGLPIIMIGTIWMMDIFGMSLNLVTLLALALVVGLVIDDAIVVRENIFRWMEKGYSARVAASKATAEVVLPVLATSATILAVFLPVAYAEGIIGQFFREFGFTVAFAIIISTFEALTLAPMLSAYFFAKGEDKELVIDESRGEETAGTSIFDRIYSAMLNWVLQHRGLAAAVSVVVVVVSLGSAGLIEQSFLPSLDRGEFDVAMDLPAGTSLAATQREALQVEGILRSHPQVGDVFATIGGRTSPEHAEFFVKVKEGSGANSRQIIEQLREPLRAVPNISFRLADNAFGGDQLLGSRDIIVQMTALDGDYAGLVAAGREMVAQLAALPGLRDVDFSYTEGNPEVRVDVDRQRAAQFGLNTAQIGATVRTLINGETATAFRGEGQKADVRVRLREEDRADVNKVLELSLLTPRGQLVPLRNVASSSQVNGPSQIQRVNRQPTLSVGANVSNNDVAGAQTAVNALLATHFWPDNVEAKLAGAAELQAESFSNLLLALALSVVFIYMVLASQFGSFTQPLLIMIAMPLAVVGAILALLLADRPLDMTAFIGFIMLMGLVTKNSILLVDFANRARTRGGVSATQAMRIAGPVRLRPILMTAISLILGMIPIALGLGPGGDFRAPMAIGIIGGMVTSTFLTLFIVPVAYSLLVGLQDKMAGRTSSAPTIHAGVEQAMQPGD